MRFATAIATALLAITTSVTAIQSKPFYLVVISDDKKINGTAFNACHSGAAIETLCKGRPVAKSNPAYTTFQFNYTRNAPNDGIVTYELQGGNFNVSEPLMLSYDPGTNVAIPVFWPSLDSPTYVSFDKNEQMYIKSYTNDTVTPPTYADPPFKLYRWYMCETYYGSYTYQTLAWTVGKAKPQNPSCQKIEVVREFA